MRIKLLILVFLMSLLSFAEAKEDVKTVQENWWQTEEIDRSFTSPYLSMDDESIYIYSEKQLDDVYIAITNNNGCVFYAEIVNIPAGRDYAVSIETLPEGEYSITLMQGNKYIIGEFVK